MKKTSAIVLSLSLAALSGVAQAENLRAIAVEKNGSYALDTDSLVQSNGRTAFAVHVIYTDKMKAPNGAGYTKEVDTLLTDCKTKTQALTGSTLMDGSGKVVYSYTPTPTEAPMITPEKNSLDEKIMRAVCSVK